MTVWELPVLSVLEPIVIELLEGILPRIPTFLRTVIDGLIAAVSALLSAWASFKALGTGVASEPEISDDDSKKVITIKAALQVFDEWYEGSTFSVSFWAPSLLHVVYRKLFFHALRAAALGQFGHTEKFRIYKGKRGRPAKGTPPFTIKYLRP